MISRPRNVAGDEGLSENARLTSRNRVATR
jgi:hypothetical protein